MAKMEDQYRIIYNLDKEKPFLVHMLDQIVKFQRTTNGLYVYVPHQEQGNDPISLNQTELGFVESQEKNKKFFLERQVQ